MTLSTGYSSGSGGGFFEFEDRRIIPRLQFFCFVLVEIISRSPVPHLGQDQSTVDQRAETAVDRPSLTSGV